MTRVELAGVRFSYGRQSAPAVDRVDFTAEPGELLCVVGPSGCGKTTLLKLISGVLSAQEGRVLFDGEDVSSVPPERRRAAMVFQSHMLFPFMSVRDNVGFGLRMQGVAKDEWIAAAEAQLEAVQLRELSGRRPASLSGGQRQRVALARALVARPRVLLLDEPLANLDRHLREEMRTVIIELQRRAAITTLCVTHDQEEAVLLGDRIAMLAEGELIQIGEASDFYERPVSTRVARFFGNHNQFEGEKRGPTVRTGAGEFRVHGVTHPDGPACMHVRPESIEMLPADAESADNSVSGRVSHRVYVGTHVRYTVEINGHSWTVVAPNRDSRFAEGDSVLVRIPADRIWLTPR